jgi:hypothetical protein
LPPVVPVDEDLGNFIVTSRFLVTPESYAGERDKYQSAVLEQYKLYFEIADGINARPALDNACFLTLSGAALTKTAGVNVSAACTFQTARTLIACRDRQHADATVEFSSGGDGGKLSHVVVVIVPCCPHLPREKGKVSIPVSLSRQLEGRHPLITNTGAGRGDWGSGAWQRAQARSGHARSSVIRARWFSYQLSPL